MWPSLLIAVSQLIVRAASEVVVTVASGEEMPLVAWVDWGFVSVGGDYEMPYYLAPSSEIVAVGTSGTQANLIAASSIDVVTIVAVS